MSGGREEDSQSAGRRTVRRLVGRSIAAVPKREETRNMTTVSLAQTAFPPLAVGFFGLAVGYLIYGPQELFAVPPRRRSPAASRPRARWAPARRARPPPPRGRSPPAARLRWWCRRRQRPPHWRRLRAPPGRPCSRTCPQARFP